MSDDKRTWFERLLTLLPAALRPREDDQRFLEACRRAYENEWAAETLARHIMARDSQAITNKPLMVIRQLERLGQRPEHAAAVEPIHEDCIHDCDHGWIDRVDGARRTTSPCPVHRPQQLEALRQRDASRALQRAAHEPAASDEQRRARLAEVKAQSVVSNGYARSFGDDDRHDDGTRRRRDVD